jgi:regulatory protein
VRIISLKVQGYPEAEDAVYTIELSDGSLFSLKTSYVSVYKGSFSLLLNEDLSVEEIEDFRFAGACYEAEKYALSLIARAEQSSLNLSFKMERREHSKSCVKKVIEELNSKEILSDFRYTEMWLKSRLSHSSKGESPKSLTASLCNRGIERATVSKVLKSLLDFQEEQKLLEKYLTKKGLSADLPQNEKSVLKAKLKQEGFSVTAIQSLWEED